MKKIILIIMSLYNSSVLMAQENYDVNRQYQKFVTYPVTVETDFLNAEEKAVLNKLFQVSELMSEIYRRQLTPDYDVLKAQLSASHIANKKQISMLFDLYFSPWDNLANDYPFYAKSPRPDGANFYPIDLSKQEFEQWLQDHPQDDSAFTGLHTVIERQGNQLIAIPYHEKYKQWLTPAIALLNEAAELSSNPSLKTYLQQAAIALATDDYHDADVAWIDIKDTVIEPIVGAYEVYADYMFNYKAAFQAFIMVKNPQDSQELNHFKKYLKSLEQNLPIKNQYKNLDKTFVSPIVVVNQLQGGGFVRAGIQNLAFNLPNDPSVRKNKGSKNVIIKNVIAAKFDAIVLPLAQHLLNKKQLKSVTVDAMFYDILFHELSHALGPDIIEKQGKKISVAKVLKEQHSTIEEAKADVMGIYNALFMLEKKQLPNQSKQQLLSSYFINFFRAMRFGLNDAHARGSAIQYHYYLQQQAIVYQEDGKHFIIDYNQLEKSIKNLLTELLMQQAQADYVKSTHFLSKYVKISDKLQQILNRLTGLPIDINPIYPEKI